MKKTKFYILVLVATVCLFVQSCGSKEPVKDAPKETPKSESVESQHNHDHNHDHDHEGHDHAH